MREKHSKSNREKTVQTLNRPFLKKIFVFLISFLFLCFILGIFFEGRILPNSYLGKINLGGVKKAQSEPIIRQVLGDYLGKSATFVHEDKIVEAKFSDFVDFDLDATLKQFQIFGQSGNPVEEFFNLVASPFSITKINPKYNFNASKFDEFISREFASFETKPEEARFIGSGEKILVSSSKTGEMLDRVFAASQLAIRLDTLSEIPIEIETVSAFPEVETTELNGLLPKYSSLLSKKIMLSSEYDTWSLEGDDLISVVKVGNANFQNGYFYEIEGNDSKVRFTRVKLLSGNDESIEILLDEDAIDDFLTQIVKAIDRPTVNATAKFDGQRVTEFTPALDGRRLDVEKTKDQIVSFISNEEDSGEFSIKLPIITTVATVANDQINSLGIKELIGKGISYFSGSIANRIYNIELGASRINGTLIAPGGIFSFNNAVGEVSGKTGYKQAYVISSGRTVLDDGGGICQVSSTVFRAALNSGLQIVARTAHAYRVGYYEQMGFGPGLDATVFSPSVDFKFRNDTDHHILVQVVFNRSRAMLEVDIYGTRDGRSVEQSKPVISNRTPAPAEIRQDDPALPKGTIKQVDFAAEGADVYFKRKVFRNGEVLYDDTFKSKFRPWQAVFLVGTGG